MDGDRGLDDVEVYDTAGEFVLGSRDDDRYAIWNRTDPATPIATFAGDDHGLEQAEQLLLQLSRANAHRTVPKLLLIGTAASLAVWIVFGLVREILGFAALQASSGFSSGEPGTAKAAAVFAIIETTGFRVAMSCLAASAAMWLSQSLQRDR